MEDFLGKVKTLANGFSNEVQLVSVFCLVMVLSVLIGGISVFMNVIPLIVFIVSTAWVLYNMWFNRYDIKFVHMVFNKLSVTSKVTATMALYVTCLSSYLHTSELVQFGLMLLLITYLLSTFIYNESWDLSDEAYDEKMLEVRKTLRLV